MRKLASVIAATAFLTSSTLALADTAKDTPQQQQGALAPGKAADVEKARWMGSNTLLILLGLGVVAGGIALAVGGSGNGSPSTTTTQNP